METLSVSIVKICFPFKKQYFDKKAAAAGFLLCGVDEVGRGCLAGPVVTCSLIIKPAHLRTNGRMPQLADSKTLTAEQRQKAYDWLVENSWFGTAVMHHRSIDAYNIYQATLRAMERAVIQMRLAHPQQVPAASLVDAMPLNAAFVWSDSESTKISLHKEDPLAATLLESPWRHVLHFYYGEEQSQAIAAASIVAKVTRDRIMQSLDPLFPSYTFGQHKGYAVPAHKKVVTLQGRSLIHRLSFRAEYDLPPDNGVQASLPFDLTPPEVEPF
jgi:ribonuclease HII